MNWWSFEYPWAVLTLIPLMLCLYRCRERPVTRYFVHLHFFAPRRQWIQLEWLLKVLTLVLLVAALASPIAVDREDPLNRQGIDMVLCLDGSGSMNASGFDAGSRRSRFEIVQALASDFVMKRWEDNIGIVLFGDFAFIASPVTYEKEMVVEMIGYLNHGMAGQNTAIGEGIVMGLRALEYSKADSKVLILLTDGDHNSGRIAPQEAVALAEEKGVIVHTIGMGEAYDQSLLEAIAKKSGGRFFTAQNRDALEEVYAAIDTLERSNIKSREYLKKEYGYLWPLLGVFGLLLYFLRQRR